ncbi:MAG: YbhB/YbcL family Raf kinase inhibitor-like protein [Bacteroidota bacterium]
MKRLMMIMALAGFAASSYAHDKNCTCKKKVAKKHSLAKKSVVTRSQSTVYTSGPTEQLAMITPTPANSCFVDKNGNVNYTRSLNGSTPGGVGSNVQMPFTWTSPAGSTNQGPSITGGANLGTAPGLGRSTTGSGTSAFSSKPYTGYALGSTPGGFTNDNNTGSGNTSTHGPSITGGANLGTAPGLGRSSNTGSGTSAFTNKPYTGYALGSEGIGNGNDTGSIGMFNSAPFTGFYPGTGVAMSGSEGPVSSPATGVTDPSIYCMNSEGLAPRYTGLMVSSPAFGHMQPIPSKYTCEGQQASPPLNVENVPEGTQSLAVVMYDPMATTNRSTTYWMMWNLDTAGSIPENFINDHSTRNPYSKQYGYTAICPIGGSHNYHFTVYALDTKLKLGKDTNKALLEDAIRGHVLAKGELVGTYSRSLK